MTGRVPALSTKAETLGTLEAKGLLQESVGGICLLKNEF